MAQITMRRGFETTIISLEVERKPLPVFTADADAEGGYRVDMVEMDSYRVTGAGFYNTSRGAYAQDVREFTFRDESEAKAKANGWFAHLIGKGWERIG
jgi:hypothetical protein